MTHVFHTLLQAGQTLDADALVSLSPFGTAHVNRFGRYDLELTPYPSPVDDALT